MIIGVGNLDRGDDAAGDQPQAPGGIGFRHTSAFTTCLEKQLRGLLAKMTQAPTVFLIDACMSGAQAGDIQRIDLRYQALPVQHHDVSFSWVWSHGGDRSCAHSRTIAANMYHLCG
jgi:hypothetical protein